MTRAWRQVFLFVGLLTISVPAAVSAQKVGNACGCGDVADLLDRINMAHAAIDKYRAEIPAIQAIKPAPKMESIAPGATLTDYAVLQRSVGAAQNEVHDPAARLASAKTHGFHCATDYNAPPGASCLLALLERHEEIHRNACKREKETRGVLINAFEGRLLIDVVNEEISAYQVEIDEAMKRLRALPVMCRPTGWVGMIQVIETKRMTVTDSTPPNNQYSKGTTRTVDDRFNRWGTIRYNSRNPTASFTAEQISTTVNESGGKVACSGGLKTVPPNIDETTISHLEIKGRASTTGTASATFDMAEDDITYTLVVGVPEVSGTVQGSAYTDKVGGCAPGRTTEIPGHPIPWKVEADSLTVEGRKPPVADHVDGSKTFDTMPIQIQIQGVDNSHQIEVVWHLHRVE